MESFLDKNLKLEDMEMNYLYAIKKMNTFNYAKNKKIELKKRSNSINVSTKNNDNLLNKYNFSNINFKLILPKNNKKIKVKTDINQKKSKSNLKDNDDDYNNIYKIKKVVTFAKNKNNNNNNDNKILFNKDMKKMIKHNSIDSDQLLIPFKSKNEYKKEDFEVFALSGKGAYGTVLQVKLKSDIEQENINKNKKEKFYAIKVMDIDSMRKVNKLYQVYLENQILNELNSPFIVQIYGTFQTKKKIYIVLDYLSKGDFATFLRMNYPLKEETIRFYAAEIVSFLEYLQSQKIVHRDLKPENIMLNDKYHLQIIDFGTVRKIGYYYDKNEMKFKEDNYDLENDNDDIKGAKVLVNPDDDDDDNEEEEEKEENNNINKIKKIPPRNKTFVGTAEYVSPEVLGDQRAEYAADIWAFGIMLYQMFCGKTPFKGATNYVTFKNIEKLEIHYEENISISENAKDLISKILIKDPTKRLGGGEPKTDLDLQHLKKHPFFKGIKWKNIFSQNVPNSKTFKFKTNKKMVKRGTVYKNENEIQNNEYKNVTILKKGLLYKKSFWFHYNERFLILDNTPKITYREPDKTIVKGIIYLNKKCKVYAVRQDIFNLETPKGIYKFKCKENDIVLWISAIKDSIKKYGKDE